MSIGLGVFCLVILPLARHLVPNPQKKKKIVRYSDNHLNTGHVKVRYSGVSVIQMFVIQMFVIQIPTVHERTCSKMKWPYFHPTLEHGHPQGVAMEVLTPPPPSRFKKVLVVFVPLCRNPQIALPLLEKCVLTSMERQPKD